MAKVSVTGEFNGHFISSETTEKKRTTKNQGTPRTSFSSLMQEALPIEITDSATLQVDDIAIEKAMDNVFVLGERLRYDYTLTYLDEYKQAVKSFLDIIRKRAYNKERVKGRIDRHSMVQKEYNLIRVIDEKLDKLVHAVLAEQRDTFYILSRIDEIRGLIINYVW